MASGRLIDYLGQGNLSDRPATPDLAPGGLGLYYATDESTLYVYSDNGWEVVISAASWVSTIVPGTGILVDDSDPENPVVSADINPVVEENIQTGTSYTLELSDAFKMVAMVNSSDNILTVPPDSEVDFPIGTRIDLSQDGTGQTTVAAGLGVTIRTPETLKLRKQWAKATLIKRAADTWDLEGNLEAAP